MLKPKYWLLISLTRGDILIRYKKKNLKYIRQICKFEQFKEFQFQFNKVILKVSFELGETIPNQLGFDKEEGLYCYTGLVSLSFKGQLTGDLGAKTNRFFS